MRTSQTFRRAAGALVAAIQFLSVAHVAFADPWVWVDPQGRFAIGLPSGWTVTRPGDTPEFQSPGAPASAAILQISAHPTAKTTSTAHLFSHVHDPHQDLPGYRVLSERRLSDHRYAAQEVRFAFRAFGSAELAREAVDTVLIADRLGIHVHMVAPAGILSRWNATYTTILRSLVIRPKRELNRRPSGETSRPDVGVD